MDMAKRKKTKTQTKVNKTLHKEDPATNQPNIVPTKYPATVDNAVS